MSHHGHGLDIPTARPRPRPQKPVTTDASRESGALRTSVLEAALQLGLGVNPAVADWMFNNQLTEEDEDQVPTSPGLTHSAESPGSSPLSGRYPLTPSSPLTQIQSSNGSYGQKNPGSFHLQHLQSPNTISLAISSESHSLIPHVPNAAHAPRPTTPSKLKKKRSANRDGYESDGAYMSDSKHKNDKKDKGRKAEANFIPPIPPFAASSVPSSSANSFLTIETTSDSTLDIGDSRKRTKPFAKASSGPSSTLVSPFDSPGYETDGGKKSKKKKSGGNDKDVKKSRSLFFRLGNKSSKGDLSKESLRSVSAQVEPPPLPIAERFATALNKETGAPMIALGSAVNQPSAGTSAPGSGLGIDLGLGLSGEMFSAPQIVSSHPMRVPTRLRTPDSAVPPSISQAQDVPPLPILTIPPPQNSSSPPVSFPPSSSPPAPHGPRPGSAGTMATNRTSTSTNATNTHSYSTGAARTSTATSVSTSQSHPQNASAKGGMLNHQPSNTDTPALPTMGVILGFSSVPPTPNKRRVLPFIGAQAIRNSASSGDSLEKEKERKREIKEREREREAKKPLISLPLTRDTEGTPGSTTLTRKPSMTSPPVPTLNIPNLPLRIKPDGSPVEAPFGSGHLIQRPSHPPVSHNFQFPPGLSRQMSLSKVQSQPQPSTLALARKISLTPLRPDSALNTLAGSTLSIPSGRTSPMPRGPGMTGVGSPPSGSRLSGLSSPPNVFAHHDIPPPSPPPLSPLPSVPTDVSSVPPSVSYTNGFHHIPVIVNGHLGVDVGIAVTTGSPLPSPLLVSSPNYNGSANGNAKVPPTTFNPSSAAAGSALRAKVQRRLSQQGGFPKLSTNGTVSPTTNSSPVSTVPPSTIPVINAPSLNRGQSIRGRESPFPVLPFPRSQSQNNTLTVNNHGNTSLPPRAMSPRSGWEDSSNSEWQSTNADEDDDGMEDVRDVIARFRESRVQDSSRKGTEEAKETADEVIPTRQSHEAFQQNAPSVLSHSSLAGNAPVSPSPSSNVMSVISDSRYDSFAVEEYYGHGSASGGSTSAGRSSTPAPPEDEPVYDDYDPEDASHYPEDELSIRRSRRHRSTVYISDEEDGSSNSGHGHGNGKSRSKRYSGSIYSRASFLDTEKSGEMRQRFLKHVEAMLDERGERVPAIPPVPKLPEEFVAEHKRAAAAARKEYEEYIMKRTVGIGARKVPAGSGR